MPAPRSLLRRLRQPGGGRRVWLGAVLALALVFKLLIPQGWMPGPDGALMLCPSGGPVVAMAGMHHGGDHAPAHAPDHPCAFAGAGLAATPPTPFAQVMRPAVGIVSVTPVPVAVAIGHGLAAPPPPPTGPPAFA